MKKLCVIVLLLLIGTSIHAQEVIRVDRDIFTAINNRTYDIRNKVLVYSTVFDIGELVIFPYMKELFSWTPDYGYSRPYTQEELAIFQPLMNIGKSLSEKHLLMIPTYHYRGVLIVTNNTHGIARYYLEDFEGTGNDTSSISFFEIKSLR